MGVFQEVISRDWVLPDVILVPRTGNSTIWVVRGKKVSEVESLALVLRGEERNDVNEGAIVMDGVHGGCETGVSTDVVPFVSPAAEAFSDKDVIFSVLEER